MKHLLAILMGAIALFSMNEAQALVLEMGGGYYCQRGSVSSGGGEPSYDWTCWYEGEVGGGGGGGGGGGTGGGGSGGSGGGAGEPSAAVPGFPGRMIDTAGKEVWAPDLDCSYEEVLRQRAAQHSLIVRPFKPISGLGSYVRVYFASSQSQLFQRQTTSGSLQFFPVSSCQ